MYPALFLSQMLFTDCGTGGSMWGGERDAFPEAMAEAGKSAAEIRCILCGFFGTGIIGFCFWRTIQRRINAIGKTEPIISRI